MKFDMNSAEFASFCAQLASGSAAVRVHELETELSEAHADNVSIREDRAYYQERCELLGAKNDELLCNNDAVAGELRDLRRLVKDLQDELNPYRKEHALSIAFRHMLDGHKIFAIKEIRSLFNLGLKEAKDVVEGAFPGPNQTELVCLSTIFRHLGDALHLPEQRSRLASLVSAVPPGALDAILAGKFHQAAVAYLG